MNPSTASGLQHPSAFTASAHPSSLMGNEQRKMVPPQLSQQRRDNLRVGEHLSKLHHPSQILFSETSPTARLP
jgi:hypothetical protein